MSNVRLALDVLQSCAAAGVAEVILCAGARNAPLVEVLGHVRGIRTYSFFEERSAAFFALGRIQAIGRPVAVVTTSGTAVAELLPAAVEAYYQGLPLVLLTADRPRVHRGSGSPQTIVQPGIFSSYVEKSWDVEGVWDVGISWSRRAPVHINVCFSEPLIDEKVLPWDWPHSAAPSVVLESSADVSISERRPLVIIGGLPSHERERVLTVLKKWRRPVYIEAGSQMRGLMPEALGVPEFGGLDFDCVVRIGSVPTLRFWRDLENSKVPVYHFSQLPFTGLPNGRPVWPLSALRAFDFEPWPHIDAQSARASQLEQLLERYPLSEPGWVRWLSGQIPAGARLFLGNSLPIREWDLAAAQTVRCEIGTNRGVNGIDGLISTFLGWCDPQKSNWALLGDLSTMYDLSGPWALREQPLSDVNLVVINNGGGKIFQRIFNNPMFENRHDLNFEHWSRMWSLDYMRLEKPVTLERVKSPRVIEIIPDDSSTQAFWQHWEKK